ncbi:unnamed protein product [Ceutorhynchus assimilis]|uniref:Uncharacterized protein n=1 Tax=Ceutorhynchus assimilis TaxID=467358 RepID=A0A9N9M925_9CUCU|nr:unnamed protein product [Ceutorhynchus assimilis]
MFKLGRIIFVVFSIIQISDLLGLGTPKQATQNCEQSTVQLTNLLSYACENIDETRNCRMDFLRAARANNNQPSIALLSLYADTYFAETQYDQCANIINVATSSTNNGYCISGYCNFVRCIRRINSDVLVAQCYIEASLNNVAENQDDQITLYKNITSCILATARCSNINPITGQPQSRSVVVVNNDVFGRPVSKTIPLYNALQINQAGDLRLITLRGSTSIQTFLCPYELNLKETSWMQYNC